MVQQQRRSSGSIDQKKRKVEERGAPSSTEREREREKERKIRGEKIT